MAINAQRTTMAAVAMVMAATTAVGIAAPASAKPKPRPVTLDAAAQPIRDAIDPALRATLVAPALEAPQQSSNRSIGVTTPIVSGSFVTTTPSNPAAAGYRTYEFAQVTIDGVDSEYRLVCPVGTKACFASFAPVEPPNPASWTTENAAKATRLRTRVAAHVAYWTKIITAFNVAEGMPPSIVADDATELTTGNEGAAGSYSITVEVSEGTSTTSVNMRNPAEQEFSMYLSDEANEQFDTLQELTGLTPAQWAKKIRSS